MASPCVELSNKMKMPILGLGTWQVLGQGPWMGLWVKKSRCGGCCGRCPWVGVSVCLQHLYNQAAGRGEQRKKATSITEGRRENKSRSKIIK